MGADGDFLSVRETARRLGVHENTVRNWTRAGVIASERLAGSRYHRYSKAEVDRLLAEKELTRTTFEPQSQWSVGPELVDATQLSQWATTRDAQSSLPELIRRLLVGTRGISNISVRAGEGVSTPGWDGVAVASGAAFLPDGHLRFELGVGSRPKAKADADFEKRAAEPEASQSIFVFITPRRWSHAASWQRAKRLEGRFADVRVLDADDLEGWLKATPAAHHWISEHLGRNPDGAQTLERWWLRFSAQTRPKLPLRFFTAGRSSEVERVGDFLNGRPAVMTLRARWREEAIAFAAAVARQGSSAESGVAAIVVSDRVVWSRLSRQRDRSVLIPLFSEPDVELAIDKGHHVLIPVDSDVVTRGVELSLPRISRSGGAEALRNVGMDSGLADKLAALSRRSPKAFIRRIAIDQTFSSPPWAREDTAATLGLLTLIGGWTESAADLGLVTEIVGQPWDDVERQLRTWLSGDDPPFSFTGGRWQVNSPQEALELLATSITRSGLNRWVAATERVLTERDPKLDLPPDQRPFAGVHGISLDHSTIFRRGVARGLALLGAGLASGIDEPGLDVDTADHLVGSLLRAAERDGTAKLWASLGDVLPLIAEASPQVFLDAVERDLESASPQLPLLFQDAKDSSWFVSSSPHTGLLWALETLCWSRDHVVEAAVLLARLALLDPGGRLSNRPVESIANVLVPWVRHTEAPVKSRILALREVCRVDDNLGWQVVRRLWPSLHATSTPPNEPEYREWRPDGPDVSPLDWLAFVSALTELAADYADAEPLRWSELVTQLDRLPPDLRNALIERSAKRLAPANLSPDLVEARAQTWRSLRKELDHHREFPDATWSLGETGLAPLDELSRSLGEPSAPDRFVYLFDWRPRLPNTSIEGELEHEKQLSVLRTDAVQTVLTESGPDGLADLAEHSSSAHHVGWSIGEAVGSSLPDTLLAWIDSDSESQRIASGAWTRAILTSEGSAWLSEIVRDETISLERRLAIALNAPPTDETWRIVKSGSPDLEPAYWNSFSGRGVAVRDASYAASNLLTYGQAIPAIHSLSFAVTSEEAPSAVSADLVIEVVESLLSASALARGLDTQSLGYEIGQLLDFALSQDADMKRIAAIEFALFRLLESYREPKALFSVLATDPSEFVGLVKRVYRGRHEAPREQDDGAQALANQAWWVLEHWKATLPGELKEGPPVGEWVRSARDAFSESDRGLVGDHQIGRVLARMAPDPDGTWPAKAARRIIEELGSEAIVEGVSHAAFNDRGPTMRAVYAGGDQERAEASKFRRWAADVGPEHRRTARMLRDLASEYERMARREDLAALRDADHD